MAAMAEANPLSIERAAAAAPDRTALLVDGEAGHARHSYRALALQARALAAELRAQVEGARAADDPGAPRVAIVADHRLETIVALLTCWEQGWTPALIHPRLTGDERRRLVDDVAPAALLDERFSIEPGRERPPLQDPVASSVRPDAGSEAAALVYTSGTEGAPRGALLPRSALAASARASEANLGWREDDRWLLSMPLAHIGGLSVLSRVLMARRTAVLAPVRAAAPERFIELVARHRVTLASLVPTQLGLLFEAEPDHRPPAHLRAVLLGGAASPAALLARAAERGVPVLTTYGLTEACSQVATQRCGTRPGPEQGSGPPLAGVRVRVAGPKEHRPAQGAGPKEHRPAQGAGPKEHRPAQGAGGEVQVAGPTLMAGYFQRDRPPELPLVDGEWFATGDLGRLDGDGRLHILGRRKELMVTGGENVHPLEVERELEACPAVAAACAFGVADDVWGEIVAAAIVARDPAIGDAQLFASVFDHARRALAPHKRPRRIARLAALATSAGGKLDRRATAERARPLLSSEG